MVEAWTVSGRKRKKHFSSKPVSSGGSISLPHPSSHHTFYALTKGNKMIKVKYRETALTSIPTNLTDPLLVSF